MEYLKPKSDQQLLTFKDEIIITEKFDPMMEKGQAYVVKGTFTLACTKGKIQITVNGNNIVVGEHELFCCMKDNVISEYMMTRDFECLIMSTPKLFPAMQQAEIGLLNYTQAIKRQPVLALNDKEWERITTYYYQICDKVKEQESPLCAAILRSMATTLALEVMALYRSRIEIWHSQTKGVSTHADLIAHRFVSMVEDYGGKERRVEKYAEELNISAKYLSTIVRLSLGQKPSKIIATATMQVIEQRLRYTDMTIKEISNELNFANTSFFGKYVREHLGMTPLEYRRRYRKK
jgi:AraC-like DNA-binding protein